MTAPACIDLVAHHKVAQVGRAPDAKTRARKSQYDCSDRDRDIGDAGRKMPVRAASIASHDQSRVGLGLADGPKRTHGA